MKSNCASDSRLQQIAANIDVTVVLNATSVEVTAVTIVNITWKNATAGASFLSTDPALFSDNHTEISSLSASNCSSDADVSSAAPYVKDCTITCDPLTQCKMYGLCWGINSSFCIIANSPSYVHTMFDFHLSPFPWIPLLYNRSNSTSSPSPGNYLGSPATPVTDSSSSLVVTCLTLVGVFGALLRYEELV